MTRQRVFVSAATHRGSVRSSNQDSILVGDWIGTGEEAGHEAVFDLGRGNLYLFVADGLGGHRSGSVASMAVIEFLRAVVEKGARADPRHLIDEADKHLHCLMARDPNLLAMGSTLVGAEVTPDVTTVFNVGDSRAYYLDGGLLQQLSVDDTLKVEVQRSSNGISKSPGITQAIGGSRKRTRPKPHIMRFTPSPGGQLLLCSDGLTDMLSNSRIRDVLHGRQGRSIELIEKAIEAGGEDNVSAVIATFDL